MALGDGREESILAAFFSDPVRILSEKMNVATLAEENEAFNTTFTSAQRADWCSRINSTIHSIGVIIGVLYAIVTIEWDAGYVPISSIEAATLIFSFAIGYFLCDLIIVIVWPIPMQFVFIIHHIVAVVPYAINNFVACCISCQFGLLMFLLVEIATLPLNARGFLETLGLHESKNHTRAIYATYVVWGITRLILPVYLVYIFWAFAYPSPHNHDVCLYPNLVCAHIIALFCVGVFFFVHTPEIYGRCKPSSSSSFAHLTAAERIVLEHKDPHASQELEAGRPYMKKKPSNPTEYI